MFKDTKFVVKKFRVTVRHDNGIVRFVVIASDKEDAESLVCKAESCPKSAIKSTREIKKRKAWKRIKQIR